MPDQGGGDVVWDVGDDRVARLVEQGTRVDAQDVPVDDLHVLAAGDLVFQRGDQALIQFDGDHPAAGLCQQEGQAAQTGADLEHFIPWTDPGGFDDPR